MMLILSTTTNINELSFCSRLKILVLMVSKLLDVLIFAMKKIRFPQTRGFSTAKEIFHNQERFPQLRKFSGVKEISHNQENFP